ncbi:MAG: helix-turn-helix transcriptional regulator [Rhizomicrobium sp.]
MVDTNQASEDRAGLRVTITNIIGEVLKIMGRKLVGKEEPGFPTREPVHPGVFLKKYILPNKSLTEKDVQTKSGISTEKLSEIFSGHASIDEEMRDKLRPAIDGAADLLYDHQKTYDYYSKNKKYPSHPL